MRRGCWLALAWCLFPIVNARAEDGALPLDLTWQAPKECASSADIRAELARIARVRPGLSVTPLEARGRIERTASGYRLSLRTNRNGEIGERQLSASECRSLARHVTLVLAVAFGEGVEILDETEASEADADAPRPAPPAPPEPPVPAAEPKLAARVAEPRRARDSAASSRRELWAGASVLFDVLPSPALSAMAGANLGWQQLWLRPRVSWLPRVDAQLEQDLDTRYDGLGGALAVCAGTPLTSLLVNACLGGSAWALRGRAWGAPESGSAVAPWYAGTADAGLSWPAHSRFRAALDAGVAVSLSTPRFVIDGWGEAHRVPRVTSSLALALVLAL
ncbi:MAG TPA: hypothetical protein VK524_10100 [Polyangiaceae bacterium]|nr:hypothetical protein [Polyangiaceae bacterium]